MSRSERLVSELARLLGVTIYIDGVRRGAKAVTTFDEAMPTPLADEPSTSSLSQAGTLSTRTVA